MKEADIEPLFLGGGMVKEASADEYELLEGYERFEAGTPNISGGIGLGRAVDYLRGIGMDEIVRHEHGLTRRILEGLSGLDRVTVYGPGASDRRIGVVSFTVDGLHPHEVAHILDEAAAIMVRSGEHCCKPLMKHLGLPNGTVRASVHVYNTTGDIDRLISTVEEITRIR
jgi:cysteine desulfurase/selenocysteine lyase